MMIRLFNSLYIYILAAICCTSVLAQNKSYQLPKGVSSKDFLANTLVIKYKQVPLQGVKLASTENENKLYTITYQRPIINSNGIETLANQQKIDENGLNRIYEVGYSSKLPIEKVITEILKDPNIAYAEPSYIYHTFAEPNDVAYTAGAQDYLSRVMAKEAWQIQPNANGVIIAIIDSGSDLQHEDLVENIYLNTADPINGTDDDKDGFIDNYWGWDFVGLTASSIVEDNNPDVVADSLDHGIHVSGLASAVSNNAKGIASLAQSAKLMIVKVGADDNASAIYKGYEGIIYAVNHGAKIINCSWGGSGGGAYGQDVINYAVSKGCLVVAAAGNSASVEPIYPSAYNGAFAVANVQASDIKSASSSYGYHIAIASPGTFIYSTVNGNKYGLKSGTSMAAPIVSSAAALVMAKNPSLTGVQAGEIIRLNTDEIYANIPENNNFLNKIGTGRLNIFKALNSSLKPSIRNQKITILDKFNGSLTTGDTINFYFDLKNILIPTNNILVNLSSTNNKVEILNAFINTGAFASEETKRIGPFKVFIKSSSSVNATVTFKLGYSNAAANYKDEEFFERTINLDYQNVTVNQVYTTITSNGRVGYSGDNAKDGLGFIFKDYSLLYEAALMIGNSAHQVSNNARALSDNVDHDFNKVVRVAKIDNKNSDYEGIAAFNDSGSDLPLGLTVKNRQIAYQASPDDKYVIVEYEIVNSSDKDLDNVFAGLFTDWDIDESSKNILKYDVALNMAYTYSTKPITPYAGIKLLSKIPNPLFYPMSYQLTNDFLADDNFTLLEKYKTLSSGIKGTSLGSGDGLDVMYTIGNGPYKIQKGKSVKLAFAFIAGDNLADINTSAVQAQLKYDGINNSLALYSEFSLAQNAPNPASNITNIIFNIPANGDVSLSLYDFTGRKIRAILNQNLEKGEHTIPLDTSTLKSGIYFYSCTYKGQQKTLKMVVIN